MIYLAFLFTGIGFFGISWILSSWYSRNLTRAKLELAILFSHLEDGMDKDKALAHAKTFRIFTNLNDLGQITSQLETRHSLDCINFLKKMDYIESQMNQKEKIDV